MENELWPFSNLSVTSPTSQLILQPFRPLYLRHTSFSNPSVASPTSQFILQSFFRFSYVTSSSLNSPGELCSFCNLSVTSPTSQLILQPFRCFTYVTVHSSTLLSLLLRHKLLHLIHLANRPCQGVCRENYTLWSIAFVNIAFDCVHYISILIVTAVEFVT